MMYFLSPTEHNNRSFISYVPTHTHTHTHTHTRTRTRTHIHTHTHKYTHTHTRTIRTTLIEIMMSISYNDHHITSLERGFTCCIVACCTLLINEWSEVSQSREKWFSLPSSSIQQNTFVDGRTTRTPWGV